jgi:hypothetical protein
MPTVGRASIDLHQRRLTRIPRLKIRCSKTIPCESCVVSARPLTSLPSVLMIFTIPRDATARDFVQQVRGLLVGRPRLLMKNMQAQTLRQRARGQCIFLTIAVFVLNHCPSAVLDATTHLHEQLAALRKHRSALQTALAEVHGVRSTELHPLLVSLGAVDSDEEPDRDEDRLVDLDIRVGTFSLAETVNESLQPSSLGFARRASTQILPTVSMGVSIRLSPTAPVLTDHASEPSPLRT